MANNRWVLIWVLVFCAGGIVRGEEETKSTSPEKSDMLLLGPGVVVTTKPYSGMDATVYPIPVITFVSGQFYIWIDTAGFRLLAEDNMTFDIIGKWRLDGYDADDSDEFEGMHDRHMTIDLGGEFSFFGDWGKLSTRILNDALGQHDGREFRVTYAKAFDMEKLKVTPSVGFALLSSNLADYYYGVRDDEARPGRPAYKVGNAVNWFTGLNVNYNLDDSWTLLASITYYWLDSDIRNSPIVDDSYAISILAGVMFRF